ncbi:MAG: DUF4328 domain-containing protein [Pseudomonadota bacterium]
MDRFDTIAQFAKIMAALVVTSSVAMAIATITYLEVEYSLLDETIEDYPIYVVMVLADLALLIVSFVAVAIWLVKAHQNMRNANIPSLRITPGWVLAWYIVPFANLFMPFLAMKELWQGSHRETVDRMARANGLLWVWWLAWIATNVNVVTDDISHLDTAAYVANAVSAAALFVIIARITKAQPNMRVETEFE